jgi:hypothetical protein
MVVAFPIQMFPKLDQILRRGEEFGGGLLETKKIGDYAMERGVPMAMRFAGSPISFRANVHCAAATENFISYQATPASRSSGIFRADARMGQGSRQRPFVELMASRQMQFGLKLYF